MHVLLTRLSLSILFRAHRPADNSTCDVDGVDGAENVCDAREAVGVREGKVETDSIMRGVAPNTLPSLRAERMYRERWAASSLFEVGKGGMSSEAARVAIELTVVDDDNPSRLVKTAILGPAHRIQQAT